VPLRVILADDHQIVRQGVKYLLEREGFDVVGEAADGREAVRLARELLPDVAVVDLTMPQLNGIAVAREILNSFPRMGVVLFTMHTEDHQVVGALRSGIRGYVLKTQAVEELCLAIREVALGGTYFSPRVSRVAESYLH